MREETSNLAAISDLGNLARDSSLRRHHRKAPIGGDFAGDDDERHANGKRRRTAMDRDGRANGTSERKHKNKNALQEAMFGAGETKKKRKSKR